MTRLTICARCFASLWLLLFAGAVFSEPVATAPQKALFQEIALQEIALQEIRPQGAVPVESMSLDIQGEWLPGALLVGQTAPGTKIFLQDRRLQTTPEGRFVFGLGRDVTGNIELKLQRDSKIETRRFVVGQRNYDVQRIEGVPQRTVTPPAEVLARIRREAALVRRARDYSGIREDFLHGFTMPAEGPITGVYGSQRVYNGVPKNPHYGLDIAAPTGTPVRAPAPGKVTLTHADMYYSGGTLLVDHGYGISSTFIHLSEILVDEGDEVRAGDIVARIGATGRATGPHLDWRINWYHVRLDPALALKHFPAPRSWRSEASTP